MKLKTEGFDFYSMAQVIWLTRSAKIQIWLFHSILNFSWLSLESKKCQVGKSTHFGTLLSRGCQKNLVCLL